MGFPQISGGAAGASPALARTGEELIVHSPDGSFKVVPLAGESISLGRAPSNTLAYPDDNGLSRQHFVIERSGADLRLRDLGSKNGTELNSQRVSGSVALQPGDRIRAGRLVIEYRTADVRPPDKTVLFVEHSTAAVSSGTVIATDLQSALARQSSTSKTGTSPVDALIRAGQELAAHRPLQELFPLILDLSMQAVQASRGVLLTSGPEGLVVQAAWGENFQISSTVRDRVLNEKTSLLVVDALSDSDLAGRNSIVMQGVRSIIAAPLQTGNEVIGLLYVDLTNPTRWFSRDDLNLLAVMANIAAIRIRHAHLIEVEAAERLHSRELSQAAEIQRGLLPRSAPVVAGLDLAGYNLPCHTVGGDYFDYLPYGEGKLAVVVGDVAGKGMPAALLMASLQAHAQALTEFGDGDVGGLVARLNKAVKARSPGNRFITLFLAVFDPEASTLTYSNAGHNPPMLLRASGEVEKLEEGGLALGMFAGAQYGQRSVPFHAGDLLILYSDGVVEACPVGEDEEFGEERLVRIVRDNAATDLPLVIDRIMGNLRTWSRDGSFADDVTLVLARRKA
jgi:sigma-B regulation protein RsbU (phosphoserine phosphatase)